jgi:NodT family efflux transporter outer membrane factor (OMF) lipoprotein
MILENGMSRINFKTALGALAAALALAAGCNFAPKYKVPPVETPVAFKETNDWKIAEPRDAAIKGKWWEMFHDPQLNQLEDQVNISNQTVVAALESFLASRAVAREAHSQLFPTVTVNPSVTKSKTSGNGSVTVGSSSNAANTIYSVYALPIDASWEPDLWGSIRNTVRANAYAAQATAAQLENMRLTIQSELAVDFYGLRAQDELIELYNTTIKDYKDSVALTQTLFDTGIDSDLDVAQADSLLQTTLATATGLGVQRAQYEHAIALLIGRPASEFSLKPLPLPSEITLPPVPPGIPSQLLERRPDIAAAERTVAEFNASIGVARAAYFPTLNLTGGAGYQSSKLSLLLAGSSFYWAAGASLAQTVFDGGYRKSLNRQAWATYRENVANYRETVLTAFQQVEDNLSGLRILTAQAGQQDIAIRATQRNLDLALERYHLGIDSYLDVITAQVSLLGNRQTAVSIQMQEMTDCVQLIVALGGGWDSRELVTPNNVLHAPGPN